MDGPISGDGRAAKRPTAPTPDLDHEDLEDGRPSASKKRVSVYVHPVVYGRLHERVGACVETEGEELAHAGAQNAREFHFRVSLPAARNPTGRTRASHASARNNGWKH